MSLQGSVEADCPGCSDGFVAPVWSFVHGGKDETLRGQAKASEVNLLLCPTCGLAFLPEVPWIYYEPAIELLAFVFPASFQKEEAKWRAKMAEDYKQLQGAVSDSLPVDHEPILFFGPDGLAALLDAEDWKKDERDVMEHYARELGLSVYRASPAWAREHETPYLLPYAGTGKPTRATLIDGMKKLLAANDALTTWSEYLGKLEKDPGAAVPPAARAKK